MVFERRYLSSGRVVARETSLPEAIEFLQDVTLMPFGIMVIGVRSELNEVLMAQLERFCKCVEPAPSGELIADTLLAHPPENLVMQLPSRYATDRLGRARLETLLRAMGADVIVAFYIEDVIEAPQWQPKDWQEILKKPTDSEGVDMVYYLANAVSSI